MARVAVIIPTFNRRCMVSGAVRSVLRQSYPDFELIVVDDGSEDGTSEALRDEFGDRLRLVRIPNRGVSAARNTGVAASSSEIVAFLDSDDEWLPRKLAAQVAYLDAQPRTDVCQTEEIWIRNGRRVNPRRHHRKMEGDIFVPSLRLCLVSPSAVMMRRELFETLGGFDEGLPACEDYDLWLRAARSTPFGLIQHPLVLRRGGHADQLSRRYWGMDRFRIASLIKVIEGPLDEKRRQAAIAVLQQKCAVVAAGARKRGRLEEAAWYGALAVHYG